MGPVGKTARTDDPASLRHRNIKLLAMLELSRNSRDAYVLSFFYSLPTLVIRRAPPHLNYNDLVSNLFGGERQSTQVD